MFVNYFESLEKSLLKSAKSAGAGRIKKGKTAKGGKAPSKHLADLIAVINGIIPSKLRAAPLRVMDKSGYSPEGVDFIAYREAFRDLPAALGGCIPSALVHGIYYVCDALTRESLADVLGRAVQGKKVNRYAVEEEEQPAVIPSFIICYETKMSLKDIKEAAVEFYVSRGIENALEFDILIVLKKGIIIKNWREKRSFKALETGSSTLMWFFILTSEYLEVERGGDLDLRDYVKETETYKEY